MILWIVLAAAASVLIYIGWGFYKVLVLDVRNYAKYWHEKSAQKIQPNVIRLLALGDSTFQGIGATHPWLGTVGRVAHYLEQKTGRPVHIANLSVSGATTETVVTEQLPHANTDAADIVIVAVGANDAHRATNLENFKKAMQTLADALPQEKTVMADVAYIKNREVYQDALEKIRTKAGLHRADLDAALVGAQKWRMSARDFFHPSDYGYTFWFKAFQPGIDVVIQKRFHEKTGH